MNVRTSFLVAFTIVVIAALLLSGCGGGDDEPVIDERKSITPVQCRLPDGTPIPGNCV